MNRVEQKIEVLAGNPWQYRNRIRLALDADKDIGPAVPVADIDKLLDRARDNP